MKLKGIFFLTFIACPALRESHDDEGFTKKPHAVSLSLLRRGNNGEFKN